MPLDRRERKNAPFFLWLDCFETHELFDPPLSYIKQYNDTWTGPKYQQPQHILSSRLHSDIRGDSVQGLSVEFVDYYTACYMAEVTFTDKYIGMFLERLDQLGLAGTTAVIFTSDHGTELADLTGLGKRESELHPFTTQLNLMLRHPDESLGDRDIEALVQNHDIAPTVLEIAGIPEASGGMDGQSLMGLITDRETEQRDFLVTGWNDYASVRDSDWNYVTNWIAESPQPELYDLRSDPEEANNVHDRHPEVASLFKRRLEEHLGGELPRPQDQLRSGGASGMEYKPLYATSYAPLFYRARMRWEDPRALPR